MFLKNYINVLKLTFKLPSTIHQFEVKDGKCVPNTTKRGFGADVSMMSCMLFLAQVGHILLQTISILSSLLILETYLFFSLLQLIISLAIGSIIDAVETNVVVIFSASIFSLVAALTASQIVYMGL